MSEFPVEIPPYRPSGDAHITTAAPKTNIRPPTFAGHELENFSSWVWKMELYLRTIRVPLEDYFGTAMFYLVEEADAFVYDLVCRNNGKNLAWDTFKSEMRECYERPTIHSDLLRQKLENVRYEGPSQMIEYCTAFCAIEQQIFNMNFDDKLRTFLRPLPTNCQVYIKLSTPANDMEACYHIARQWAHAIKDTRFRKNSGHVGKPSSSRTSRRQDRSRKRGILAPPPRTENPGDELDVLNRMATDKDQCFKCGKNGHFQSDCPCRDHDKHDNQDKQRWKGGRRSFSARKPSFRAMNDSDDSDDSDDNGKEGHSYSKTPDGYAEDLYSDDNDDNDYEYQERQLSFRAMEMKGSDGDSDSDSDKDLDATQDNLYKVSMDGLEARTPKSTILPIYNAEIAGTTRKAIIDSGASTLYISQRAVEELGLQMTHVKARRVKVADHSRCTVDRITTVDAKVGNLPTEILTT